MSNNPPSIIVPFRNRAQLVLQHGNRVRFTVYLSAMWQTMYISSPAQPFTFLYILVFGAMLHLARRVHHI